MVLVSSGVTLTLAHQGLLDKSMSGPSVVNWVVLTVVLGLIFEILQVEEWLLNSFRVVDGVRGRYFYFITGFHGLHVMVGVVLNIVVLVVLLVLVEVELKDM